MKEYLVVDGYNVINAWPELKALAQENLEHARLRLLDILANYRGLTGLTVIVAFDAHGVKGAGERQEYYQGVQVVYSRENETADSVIERFVHSMRGEKIHVATSDWDEQRIVFGSGAYRLSARQLREDVIRAEQDIKGRSNSAFSGRTLESRLSDQVRKAMEMWRRSKG